jgi:hypothetical protein
VGGVEDEDMVREEMEEFWLRTWDKGVEELVGVLGKQAGRRR